MAEYRYRALVLLANTKHLYNIYTMLDQRHVFDVGPTLYKCDTNALCLLGHPPLQANL